jgi:hypothetical protein
MQGVPVVRNEAVSALEQIETLVGMLGAAIHLCETQGNICTRPQLNGFSAVLKYAQGLVQEISTDQSQIPLAKQYSQVLGELANTLKGFAQRLMEQEQAGNRDPEAEAKIMLKAQESQLKNAATQEKNQQSLQHKQASFEQSQSQKAEMHALQQQMAAQQAQMKAMMAKIETMTEAAKAKVEINVARAKAANDIAISRQKAEAVETPDSPES